MQVLIIDNHDSFTFNLYQYLGEMGLQVQVRRNDQLHLEEVKEYLNTANGTCLFLHLLRRFPENGSRSGV